MPFVSNNDIKIHYQTEGDPEKPAMVLMHWFMGSIHTWYDITWARSLKKHFFLIMIDHRGYGKSSKPHSIEAYLPNNHVSDIIKVLDHLQIDTAHFFGYSMGARIGFAMAAYAPERIDRIALGGMHPYASEKIPTDLDERIRLLEQGMKVTLDTYKIRPPSVYNRMMENDPNALIADTKQTKQWKGLEVELKDFDRPMLLFVGKEDGFYSGVKRASYELNNVHFVSFSGEDHRSAFTKKRLLVPHLSRFLNVKLS